MDPNRNPAASARISPVTAKTITARLVMIRENTKNATILLFPNRKTEIAATLVHTTTLSNGAVIEVQSASAKKTPMKAITLSKTKKTSR